MWEAPVEPLKTSTVVFVDNQFPNFFSQIEYLFKSGFLPPDTVILAKYRHKNYRSVLDGARKYNVPVRFYDALKRMPKIAPGAVIVYPFHGPINLRLMALKGCKHVFVGHGDSNKRSSTNLLVRAYDYVLIAGELSRDRLIDQGVLRPHMRLDHSIAVGTSMVDQGHAEEYDYAADGQLGYFPTWEGGPVDGNYCSIPEPNTICTLVGLAARLSTDRIILDLHPNSGQRGKEHRDALRILAETLIDRGLKVSVRWRENKQAALAPLKSLISSGIISIERQKVNLAYAAVDVSAAEGIVASRGVPSVVLWRDQTEIYPSAAYRTLRRNTLVPLSDTRAIERFLAFAGTAQDRAAQDAFAWSLFSYDDPEMREASHSERWNLLRRKYFFPERDKVLIATKN